MKSLQVSSGFSRTFYRVTQFLTWPIAFLFFNCFFRMRIGGRRMLREVKSPFIIISNHISFYDSFLFRLILGFSTTHLPLRFIGVRHFKYKSLNLLSRLGIIDSIYSLFGVFVAVKGETIGEACNILKQGGNLVVYPEGEIVSGNMIGRFRKGAAVIAQQAGVSVLPISLRLGARRFLRRDLFVHVGELVEANPTLSVEEITATFHKSVLRLYEMNI